MLVVLVAVAAFVALLAAMPYIGRRSRRTLPADGRTRRLLIIGLVVAAVLASNHALSVVAGRRLDEAERTLRADLHSAGPSRLEEARRGGLAPPRLWSGPVVYDPLASVTSVVPFDRLSWQGSADEAFEATAKLHRMLSARCFHLTIRPGGDHTLNSSNC